MPLLAALRRAGPVPLARDFSARFVPWIIALMVFLAALSMVAAMHVARTVARWDQGLRGSVTVQIPARPGQTAAALDAEASRVAAALRATPGVAMADALSPDRLAGLLEPWLGPNAMATELPIPRLIDVRLASGMPLDLDALTRAVKAAAPSATVDTHRAWLDRLLAYARTATWVARAAVGLIGAAAVATVIFATLTRFSIHRDTIELLHLMGASDRYVARQFQGHAFRVGLLGGMAGLAAAALTLAVLESAAADLTPIWLPNPTLGDGEWLALAALPLASGLIATATARATVLHALARMM